MGQNMSFNNDLIHAMKKMRLNGPGTVPVKREIPNVIRILDIPSPSSPVRKQSGGNYDIIKHAVNAPFENDLNSTDFDDNIDALTTDDGRSIKTMMKFSADTPVLDSEQSFFTPKFLSGLFLIGISPRICHMHDDKIDRFADSYTNEELITFMLQQEERSIKLLVNKKFDLKSHVDNRVSSHIDSSLSYQDVKVLEPSDEEIVRHLKSF
jgi:hypothetical protein